MVRGCSDGESVHGHRVNPAATTDSLSLLSDRKSLCPALPLLLPTPSSSLVC